MHWVAAHAAHSKGALPSCRKGIGALWQVAAGFDNAHLPVVAQAHWVDHLLRMSFYIAGLPGGAGQDMALLLFSPLACRTCGTLTSSGRAWPWR